jgi:hypothetical protein
MSDETKVYRIDVSAKYALKVDRSITRKEADEVKDKWNAFINDPNDKLIVLGYGVDLIKIEKE